MLPSSRNRVPSSYRESPISKPESRRSPKTAEGRKRQFIDDLESWGDSRPTSVTDGADMLAVKRPLAACGKLTRISNEPSRSAGSARVSLHKFGAFHRRFRRLSNP